MTITQFCGECRSLDNCGADVGISASLVNASASMFQLPTLNPVETCVDMMTKPKSLLGLRYFTMLCRDAEYKNMDKESLSQLYNMQN